MDPNALYYALSTIAQCAAALAALIGFLGLWRLDRLREETKEVEEALRESVVIRSLNRLPYRVTTALLEQNARRMIETPESEDDRLRKPDIEVLLARWVALPGEQRWLIYVLTVFLVVTLMVILAPAIVGLIFVNDLLAWAWTPWLIGAASALLAIAPTCVVLIAARSTRGGVLAVVLTLAWVSPAIAGSVCCTTYEDKTLGRWQTLCDDGTRAVSTWSPTLGHWEPTVTTPPGKTCTGQLNPRTYQ